MIKKIFANKEKFSSKEVKINGWVISNRGNNKIRFLTINDGSTFENIQVVIKDVTKELDQTRIGAAIEVVGNVVLTPEGKQELEIISKSFMLLRNTDEDFPLQKNGISREVLRDIPHLRHRTNTFRAIMRVRSTLLQEVHNFFFKEGFLNVAAPIITSNDGEGAGESFVVDDETDKMFFNTKATLGVTGQLHAESYAIGFGKVYTFAPTFRAENSHTTRHASEFWMIEPEVAFAKMSDGIELADKMIKFVISNTLKKHPKEFEFLNKFIENGLIDKLNNVVDTKIKVMDYSDVLNIIEKTKDKFKENKIYFGIDLATEHERYIAEEVVNGPVAIVNYPKEIKAFYMHQNSDGKTVSAFDILVPGIGELVGGSQREVDLSKLETRIKEVGINKEEIQWYLDLRRFGDSGSTGFGVGFERLVMYVTGINNIRDAIPFPRTPKNLKM